MTERRDDYLRIRSLSKAVGGHWLSLLNRAAALVLLCAALELSLPLGPAAFRQFQGWDCYANPAHVDEGHAPLLLPKISPGLRAPVGTAVPLARSLDNERQYDQIWSLVKRYFLYRDRLKTWNQWRHKFDGKLLSAGELRSAIDQMLNSLKDQYTFFRDREATHERATEDKRTGVVNLRYLGHKIGYIHIATFCAQSCVAETKHAIARLQSCSDIILDLRENNGGTVDDATRVFSLFADSGKYVTMLGFRDGKVTHEQILLKPRGFVRSGEGETRRFARQKPLARAKRLVVLIDKTTKSAAEMLAGALRDNRRAVLIGNRSFGKGVVQRVWEFDNGTSVKITSARFSLPRGAAVNGVGVRPDLFVRAQAGSDNVLKFAQHWLRRGSQRQS